ncbi:MAG: FtsQ-type POTRA domain-containing protein [Holosporales bacterium]|jgi:cell division protein FtsQ|nr:FtsQ-type POTRA domain-containing protein [Holosporales bacterium]
MAKRSVKPAKRKKHGNNRRWIGATAALSLIATTYIFLPAIKSSFLELSDFIIRDIGFVVKDINISGATPRTSQLISRSLGITRGDNMFKLSVSEIYDNVTKSGWVKSATVQKNLPNIINIKINERVPIAIFQHDGVATLIDREGVLMEDTTSNREKLPIVSGDNANVKATSIISVISKFEVFKGKIDVIRLVRDRRWDITVSGLLVKLPEYGVDQAIEALAQIMGHRNISKDTASCIDLRIHGNVVIKGSKLNRRSKGSV